MESSLWKRLWNCRKTDFKMNEMNIHTYDYYWTGQYKSRTTILIVQVYMPTSEYEDDEVEKLYGTTEEILEEDGKCDTNTIILGDWNSVVGDESHRNIVGSHGLGRRNHRGQMLIDVCERNWLSPTHGSRSQKEDCTHGRHLQTGVDISWTTSL